MSANIQPMFEFGEEWEPYIIHDVNGVEIKQRRSDGYIDVTAMCRAHQKLFADYSRLKSTNEYLSALSLDMGIPISELIDTSKGGSRYQGSMAHPEVAVDCAHWCSPIFRVKVNRWVLSLIIGKPPKLDNMPFDVRRITDEIRRAYHGTRNTTPAPEPKVEVVRLPPPPTPEQIPWADLTELLTIARRIDMSTEQIKKTVNESRKHQVDHTKGQFSPEVRALVRRTVFYKFHGCCLVTGERVLDDNMEVIRDEQGPVAEYDHHFGPKDGSAENCWLPHRSVHLKLTTKKLTRRDADLYFELFQRKLAEQRADEEGQLRIDL